MSTYYTVPFPPLGPPFLLFFGLLLHNTRHNYAFLSEEEKKSVRTQTQHKRKKTCLTQRAIPRGFWGCRRRRLIRRAEQSRAGEWSGVEWSGAGVPLLPERVVTGRHTILFSLVFTWHRPSTFRVLVDCPICPLQSITNNTHYTVHINIHTVAKCCNKRPH